MAPWSALNFSGKFLIICCIINMIVAITFVQEHEASFAIFCTIMAAYCGLSTYQSKYQHKDAEDINDTRER